MVKCNNSERDDDVETLSARESALAFHIFDDILREVHRAAISDPFINESGVKPDIRSCVESTSTTDSTLGFPATLTIHYGANASTCDDDLLRQGTIRAKFSGKYLNDGTKVKITLTNFKKDNYLTEGSITLTSLGLTSENTWRFFWEVEDGNITSNNTNIQWNCSHQRWWITGQSTFDSVDDDIFMTQGTSSGRNSRGNTFNIEITSAYVSDFSCPWVTEGKGSLTIPNLASRGINYDTDNMSCDNMLYERRNNTYFKVEIP
ncbi:MAG: hypothetical protein R2813_01525 [Flavobacteriales bacterium]